MKKLKGKVVQRKASSISLDTNITQQHVPQLYPRGNGGDEAISYNGF